MGSTPIPPGDSQAVPKAKPKPKPKSSAPKVKTDEQLARAAVVKANANLLEISQWDYKLANASVPKVVRDAYVSSMETEGKELRDAKTAVELALSLGQSLKEPTEKLESANENYRKSSGQVKKACDHSFADFLISSLGRGATSCAELQKAAHASVKEAEVARRGYVSCEEIGSGAEKPLLYPPTGEPGQLAILSVLRSVARWRLLPKVHPFRHMNEDMRNRLYNYRYCHTFKDEDNVGVCKKLAERVAKGDLMEYRIMTRFLLRVGSWVP
ncbi:unnamed protein product [Cladocopium goreaui]|uniref:Uncharacterized protein n=1 Tax=Cladocopium goreaui TaxID=2562237 RepID=A0A9P1BPW8_9DINO|nr:unnamed protein product [Cladocopium goreaui]